MNATEAGKVFQPHGPLRKGLDAVQHAPERIITKSTVTADTLAGEFGARAAPECPDFSCHYRTELGDCSLPACRENWQESADRLARWAIGRRAEELMAQGASLKDVYGKLDVTERVLRLCRDVYAADGWDWTTRRADHHPYRPVTWGGRGIVGRCSRCGGTVQRTAEGRKCSMCSRLMPVTL